MTGVQDKVYEPIAANVAVYEQLFRLYRQLHDAFGVAGHTSDLSPVMKQLLEIRDRANASSASA